MTNLGIINTLAAQIRKANGSNRSESMKSAYKILSTSPDAEVIAFKKMSTGTIERRVVSKNWSKYQAPVGGKSNVKEGQILFADLGKFAAGVRCIISTYQQNIIARA